MKRNINLRNLSSDHHHALTLTRKIMNAVTNNNDIGQLIAETQDIFYRELAPHFALEEKTILAELEKAGEHTLVTITLKDHRQLRALVQELDAPGNLFIFAERLKEHVRFEENILFNTCQQVLKPDILQRIGEQCQR